MTRLDQDRSKHFTAAPAFIITIDTEGDNLWSRPRRVTTENAKFLPRFQSLCEKWSLKPTYLVDFDMASCPDFVAFGQDLIRRDVAELGMHLHPWNSPPKFELTDDDVRHHPYLIEYPESAMRDKVAFMTDLLTDTFGVPMHSHRAGRWAMNETYAKTLIDHGYRVDCSVTPNITWQDYLGDPRQTGGRDYRDFPQHAYLIDESDIGREGQSTLLEVPMTIRPCTIDLVRRIQRRCAKESLMGRALNRMVPRYTWFRPRRDNLPDMLNVLRWSVRQRHAYIEFMLHSSEFMPGGSPTFKTADDIESLFESLEVLFEAASQAKCKGTTLNEFYESVSSRLGRGAPVALSQPASDQVDGR